jgi:hypothetical protein
VSALGFGDQSGFESAWQSDGDTSAHQLDGTSRCAWHDESCGAKLVARVIGAVTPITSASLRRWHVDESGSSHDRRR